MKLDVNLDIKFRFLRIDLGHWSQKFVLDVPPEAVVFAGLLADKVKYDDHGVKLSVSAEVAA